MKLTKSFAALVAASALVIVTATPASATLKTLAITTGTVTTATVGAFGYGSAGTTGPCSNFATDTDVIALDEVGTTTTTTAITSVAATSSLNAGTPTAPYAVATTKYTGSNTGGFTSTGIWTQNFSFRVEFRTTTSAPSCVPGTLVCALQSNGNVTGSIFTGTVPLTPSTAIHASGTSHLTAIPFQVCNAPFATLVSTTVVFTSLTLHTTL